MTLETQPGAHDAPPASFDPLDWALAERVARRVAGRDPLSSSYLAESLRADFSSVTAVAEQLVADHTGLRAPGPARAQVVDRATWVSANVRSMRRLLEPLTARVGERMAGSPVAPIGRRIAGTETGCVARVPRATRARPVRPARPRRGGRCIGRRLLRGRQHPGAGEAVRVPATRLPAVDRDPRVHAPGAVHGGVVDEAVLPLAGRRDAVVDRSRSAPTRASARARSRRIAQRSQPARRRWARRAPGHRRAARRARRVCSRSCRCSKDTATA